MGAQKIEKCENQANKFFAFSKSLKYAHVNGNAN